MGDLEPLFGPASDIDVDILLARLTALRAGYLDELAAANIPSDIDDILADTGELQTDWADGGRLDLLIDAILADTATIAWGDITTIDGLIDDIIADIGTFPTANYATLAAYVEDVRTRLIAIVGDTGELQTDWADGGRLDLLIDAILADTGELQTDWANGGRLDLLIDAILADTGELQTDWANGGRLDLLIDDIKAETDQLPNWQSETEWSSTPTIQALANAAATALTAGSITPTYPTGATRVRAILIATIHCANTTAVAHHIKFKIEGQKAAGGYGDLLDLTAQEGLSMVDVDGATDGWSGAIDVTALVDTSGVAYDFRFEVDSDNAGNVIYICSFVLALVYTM